MRVESRTATEVQDVGRFSVEQPVVNPGRLPVDPFRSAAGQVVVLREMFRQHPSAEGGIVPRNFVVAVPYIVVRRVHV